MFFLSNIIRAIKQTRARKALEWGKQVMHITFQLKKSDINIPYGDLTDREKIILK